MFGMTGAARSLTARQKKLENLLEPQSSLDPGRDDQCMNKEVVRVGQVAKNLRSSKTTKICRR